MVLTLMWLLAIYIIVHVNWGLSHTSWQMHFKSLCFHDFHLRSAAVHERFLKSPWIPVSNLSGNNASSCHCKQISGNPVLHPCSCWFEHTWAESVPALTLTCCHCWQSPFLLAVSSLASGRTPLTSTEDKHREEPEKGHFMNCWFWNQLHLHFTIVQAVFWGTVHRNLSWRVSSNHIAKKTLNTGHTTFNTVPWVMEKTVVEWQL